MSGQTRRKWMIAASSTMFSANAATAIAFGQTAQSAPPVPNQATTAPTPEAMMQKAQKDVQTASEKLAAIEVPMTLEPAFQFKA